MMRIALASDHAGVELKSELIDRLAPLGHELVDLGGHDPNAADDYPDYARSIALAVREGRVDRGILICGSGVGAAIAASKIPGIRAGLCHDTYSAAQGVEHDDMNILTLGARVIGVELAVACSLAFLRADFSGEERHVRRLGKVRQMEMEGARLEIADQGDGAAADPAEAINKAMQ